MFKKAYLLSYNGILFAGWSLILTKMAQHFISGGSVTTIYPLIKTLLMVSQTTAIMEILHSLVGIVRSPVFTTFVQVLSRLIVLWGAVEIGCKDVTSSWFFSQMVVAWSLSEVIRYSFYALNLIDKDAVPRALTWVRYSAFMVLYPVGITGEIMCLVNALDHVKAHNTLSISLPNPYNFAFSFHGFIWFALFGMYPYGSYIMYSYMLAQRKKTLYPKKKAE